MAVTLSADEMSSRHPGEVIGAHQDRVSAVPPARSTAGRAGVAYATQSLPTAWHRTRKAGADVVITQAMPSPTRLFATTARWLTTPLVPDDYLGYVKPLWCTEQPRGRVDAVLPETAD